MRRIMMRVAYDGTGYCGWQVQPNGLAVQEVLNRSLSELLKEDIHTIGASRTDAGVHARGNVAVFDTESRMAGEKIAFAVNTYLPEDIRILKAWEAAPRFHSRLSAAGKTYAYYVETGEKAGVFERKYVYQLGRRLDLEAMRKAAALLEGEHDFKSFCGNKRMKKSTVRRLERIEIREEGSRIVLIYTGNGFLYQMVRILTGTLLEVGLGTRAWESMEEILSARDRQAAGWTAPPEGLFLAEVQYPKNIEARAAER